MVRDRGGGGLSRGTAKSFGWPQGGDRHNNTHQKGEACPGGCCPTNPTHSPADPAPAREDLYHPCCTDEKTEAGRGTQVRGPQLHGISSHSARDPGHPHGGSQDAGLWGAICPPSCPVGASAVAQHLPLGTELWQADLTQRQATRLSEKYRPHGYDRFHPQDNTSESKCVAFPHQPPTVQQCGHPTRTGCPVVSFSVDGDDQSQPHVSTPLQTPVQVPGPLRL